MTGSSPLLGQSTHELENYNCKTEEELIDDIERLTDSNEMVEEIISTLANISNDFELHSELILNGILEVIKKYIELYLSSAKLMNDHGINELIEGIKLSVMPTGSLNLMKAIAITIKNISSNPKIH